MVVYRFGDFTLDVSAHQLRRGRVEVSIEPRAFDTLLYLVERPGRLVRKGELLDALWADVIVTEGALVRSIVEVRKALGDNASRPLFVQTIPRVGYKFIAEVHKQPTGSEPPSRDLPPDIHSMAVLPFVNLNGDPDQDYFVDGMTDLLITDLGKIGALRVISRTSAMCYKGTAKPLPEIGRDLNIDAVIEGAVLRVGERVRITAQLVETRTDRHLWAESYERELQDILQLQSQVAQDIAGAVRVKLTPQEQARLATVRGVSVAAHEAYLIARYFWHKGTEEGLGKSIEYFQQAIATDPACAPAYAGLADCYGVAGFFGYVSPKDAFPRMKEAATRALAIDSCLAEAHTSVAAVNLFYGWDGAAALRELKQALELNPNYPLAYEWYGWYLTASGRVNEAVQHMNRTRELDPLALRSHAALGMCLYFARRHDEALEKLRIALQLDSNYRDLHCTLGLNYQQKGMFEEAIDEFQRALALSGRSPEDLASVGYVHALAGMTDRAREILAELKELATQRYVDSVYIAAVHAGLGEWDEAFVHLEKAYEERSGWLVFLRVEPWWDGMHEDPRFEKLVRRVGLCE